MQSEGLDSNEYYVEKVLDKRVIDGELRYLIKWDGWSEENNTWEPLENLGNIKNLIDEYEKEQLLNPKNKKGVKSKVDYQKQNSAPHPTKSKNSLENEDSNGLPKQKKIKEFKEKKEEENKNSEILGSLGINVPEEVVSVKRDADQQILCLVKFKERPDGITPEDAFVPSSILRELYPKILIKFYESKIKFVDKK
jgi:chromobox protein 5